MVAKAVRNGRPDWVIKPGLATHASTRSCSAANASTSTSVLPYFLLVGTLERDDLFKETFTHSH
jgi:hypothetical protein